MEPKDKSLDDKKKSMLSKNSITNWEPDENLKKAIEKSWGLDNVRPADTRS